MQRFPWIAMLAGFLTGLLRDATGTVRQWPTWKKLACVALLAGFVAVTVVVDVPSLSTLRAWAAAAGDSFIVLFVILYIAITQFPIPRTLLTLASGVLFGPVLGIGVALIATTASAVISLLVVRSLLGEWMRPRLRHPAVARINAHLRRRGWLAIGSLRMIAGIPFSVLNYVAALTPVKLAPFAVATLVGSAPGTAAVVVFGDALTGHISPNIIVVTIGLAVIGVIGLVLDTRLPVAGEVKPSG